MMAPDTLLREYAVNGSESAFREVVARYLDLVYSTAVRLVDGDVHRAEDVAQTVFADLARRAGALPAEVMLGGWLHRRTCHVAATLMRSERRRRNREREAAEMTALERDAATGRDEVAPFLDEAINQLRAEDRTALLLRYFEGRDLRAVGAALGSNEDAAQKRVARALERLRGLLLRRGVTTTGAGLAAVLSAHAVSAAPAGLAASISGAALASGAAGGATALTLFKLMALSKLKLLAGTALVAGLGTALVLEHQARARLREQNQVLERQVAGLSRTGAERPAAAGFDAAAVAPASPPTDPAQDLARLRREVAALREQPDDLPRLRATNRELKAATDEPDDPAEAEFRDQTRMRLEHLKQWGLSFILYAGDHEDRVPESFEEAASVQGSESLLGFDTNHFEIVYRGNLAGVADPGKTLLFRERQARRSPQGSWVKVYGLADGSTVTRAESEETAFEAWEKDRVVARP